MDPGEIPPELVCLTPIEEMLVARVYPIISFHQVKGSQCKYSGHVVNFFQNINNFVNELPRKVSELTSLIVVKRKDSTFKPKEFIVSKTRVLNALYWLKDNHRYYFDITINNENLNELEAETVNVYDLLPNAISEDENELKSQIKEEPNKSLDENENDWEEYQETHTGLVDPIGLTSKQHVNNFFKAPKKQDLPNIDWPEICESPVNEYVTQGYITMAFPTLFPYGKADLLQRHPKKEIKHKEYFTFLFNYRDGRFSKHKRFRYFAVNSFLRWSSCNHAKYFVERKKMKNMSVEELKDKIKSNPKFMDNISAANQNLRGTTAYWNARTQEVLAMIDELGSPHFFFTLSAADEFWPEMYEILNPSFDWKNASEREIRKEKRRLFRDNPDDFAYFFKFKVQWFFKNVLKKSLDVVEFFYRVEFQHRGSPHIHGIVWVRFAPDMSGLGQPPEKVDKKQVEEVEKFFSKFISAQNPNSSLEFEIHPCSVLYGNVPQDGHLNDLAALLKACQSHTRCSSYCLNYDKKSNSQKCRFNFPKPLRTVGKLEYDSKLQAYSFEPARNDGLVNNYNRFFSEHWRANIDLQAITSKTKTPFYITKYATKPESRSTGFKQFLTDFATSPVCSSDTVTKTIKQALNRMINDRDYSQQDCMFLINGYEYYHCSRSFKKLYLTENDEETLVCINPNRNPSRPKKEISESGSDESESSADESHSESDEDTKPTKKKPSLALSHIELYSKRPKALSHVSLKTFYESHYQSKSKASKGKWLIHKKKIILQVYPKIPQANENLKAKQVLLLNVPFRNVKEFNVKNDDWFKLLNEQYPHLIPKQTNLGMNELDEQLGEEYDEQFISEKESRQNDSPLKKTQIEILSKALPTIKTLEEVALGEREFDVLKEWDKNSCDEEQLTFWKSFISIAKKDYPKKSDYPRPACELNAMQQEIVDLLNVQISDIQAKRESTARTTLIQGKAGTGKSLVIHYITSILFEKLGAESFLLLAPTGVAACNIEGHTLHSKLLIADQALTSITPKTEERLQKEFAKLKFVIIDEFSMIGCNMLSMIDQRLRQITAKTHRSFGGLYVYMFGDIKQLPPVKDKPLFMQELSNMPSSLAGRLLFTTFDKYCVLQESMRQQGVEQNQFRNFLDRLADCGSDDPDFDYLEQRRIDPDPIQDERLREEHKQKFAKFENSIRIFFTNEEVNAYNMKMLKALNRPLCLIRSKTVTANGNKRSFAPDHLEQGLINELTICEGCKVMLRCNLFTEAGLVNGAIGTVEKIIFRKGDKPPEDMPEVIMVRFPDYKGPTLENGCVPIPLISKSWKDKNTVITRTQFPLVVCFALTAHKTQGLTLDDAVVCFDRKDSALGQTYVACSRVRTVNDLAIFGKFSKDRLTGLGRNKDGTPKAMLLHRLQEEENLLKKQNSPTKNVEIQKQYEEAVKQRKIPPKRKQRVEIGENNSPLKKAKTEATVRNSPKTTPVSKPNVVDLFSQTSNIDQLQLNTEKMEIDEPVIQDPEKNSSNQEPNPFDITANDAFVKQSNEYFKKKKCRKSHGAQGGHIIINGEFTNDFELETYIIKRMITYSTGERFGLVQAFDFTVNEGLTYLKEKHSSFFEKVFVVINHNQIHWFLGVIDLIEKRVLILDSLKGLIQDYKPYAEKLFKLTKAICQIDSRNLLYNTFKLCHPILGVPQQPVGSVECGPYMCHFIEYIISPEFSVEYFSYCSQYKRYEMNKIIGNNVRTQEFQNDLNRNNRCQLNEAQFQSDQVRLATIMRNSIKDFEFNGIKE